MRARRGPYTTRLTMPRGMSYSSGIASGRASARYGLIGVDFDVGLEVNNLDSGCGCGCGLRLGFGFCGEGVLNEDGVWAASADLEPD